MALANPNMHSKNTSTQLAESHFWDGDNHFPKHTTELAVLMSTEGVQGPKTSMGQGDLELHLPLWLPPVESLGAKGGGCGLSISMPDEGAPPKGTEGME